MGLMFPKEKTRKKRKRHPPGILQSRDERYCYLCARLYGDYREKPVHWHHIYPGNPGRRISEAHGFAVNLCIERHHQYGPEAVHVNHDMARLLQEDCQRAYEKEHSREEFLALIGRNYL